MIIRGFCQPVNGSTGANDQPHLGILHGDELRLREGM